MRRIALLSLMLAVPALASLPLAPARADDMADMPGMAKPPPGPADSALMDSMARMQRDMAAAPMTGDADRDFVEMMIPHHRGAIDMARALLAHGHDPKLRALAEAIVAAQEREIAEMRLWLETHRGP